MRPVSRPRAASVESTRRTLTASPSRLDESGLQTALVALALVFGVFGLLRMLTLRQPF
jgi:hypothetical protein